MKKPNRAAAVTAVAGGLVAAGTGTASAEASARGVAAGSPGAISGNVVQIPIDLQLNACGNTVGVVGLVNPSFGNRCTNTAE